MADQSSGSIVSSMIRSYGNLKPRLPSRRCTCHQLSRSSASHKSIFPGFHRWRPRGFAGGRKCPSNLKGIAIGGYPTLRILRPVLRIDRAPACEAAGSYAVAGGVNTVDPVDLSYKRLSADAAATAGGTVTTDLFWRYHKHPRPILRLTHRAPARGALHGHLDALSSKA